MTLVYEKYYLLLSELFLPFISLPRRICWCQTSEATSGKYWKWALTTKTNEMGGGGGGGRGVRREGRGKLLFCFFRQALIKLTVGVFKFSSPYSPCGQAINGGIMALVG